MPVISKLSYLITNHYVGNCKMHLQVGKTLNLVSKVRQLWKMKVSPKNNENFLFLKYLYTDNKLVLLYGWN